MKYYSKKIFRFLLSINILNSLFALIMFIVAYGWSGLSLRDLLFEGEGFIFNLFAYVILIPFFICSTIIIWLQQKKHKNFGYLMVISSLVSIFYLTYMQIKWGVWSNIGEVISTTPFLILLVEIVLFIGLIIPFYVVGRLVWQDFLKKR